MARLFSGDPLQQAMDLGIQAAVNGIKAGELSLDQALQRSLLVPPELQAARAPTAGVEGTWISYTVRVPFSGPDHLLLFNPKATMTARSIDWPDLPLADVDGSAIVISIVTPLVDQQTAASARQVTSSAVEQIRAAIAKVSGVASDFNSQLKLELEAIARDRAKAQEVVDRINAELSGR